MSVVLITSIKRWIGVSGDSKPTTGAAGSTFFETDTTDAYIWNGSAWSLYPPGSGASAISFTAFTDGDTTPSVAGSTHFKTANTGATTITAFDDLSANGHEIHIDFGDANTTIQASASIRLQGGITSPDQDFGPSAAGDSIDLYYNGTETRERGRSLNS